MLVNYIKGQLKRRWIPMAVVSVLGVVIVIAMGDRPSDYEVNEMNLTFAPYFSTVLTVMAMWAMLVPIMQFADYMSKRNVDTVFALPVKRTSLMTAELICSAVQVLVPYTVMFLFWFLYRITGKACFDPSWVPVMYLWGMWVLLVQMLLAAFWTMNANTLWDAVIFVLLGVFLPDVARGSLEYIGVEFSTVLDENFLSFYGDVMCITENLERFIFLEYLHSEAEWVHRYTELWAITPKGIALALTIWSAVGVAAVYGIRKAFATRRAEDIEGTSDSLFGYKLILPIYSVGGMLFATDMFASEMLYIIGLAIILTGFAIYRRGFRLKRWDIVFIAAMAVMAYSGLFVAMIKR